MKKLLLAIIFALIIGFTTGYIYAPEKAGQESFKIQAIRAEQNGLIDPLLEYELDSNLFKKEIKPFKDKVEKLVNDLKSQKKANNISVYFRDLNNGPWFGIEEDKNFFPASLLKLPIMITYLKQAETDPKILEKKIKYDESVFKMLGNFNNGEYIKSEKSIQEEKTYTVEELINYMIVYSDNNAKNLLVLNLENINKLFKTYTDLGIADPPELENQNDEIFSVHEYATFFRILYNSSYLSKEMSKKALGILVKTKFHQGIKDGIPENILLAHKFGEHTADSGNIKQLHDCGIIYHPKYPYLLCVMTRGTDFPQLEYAIQKISKLVYEEVDRQAGAPLSFNTYVYANHQKTKR